MKKIWWNIEDENVKKIMNDERRIMETEWWNMNYEQWELDEIYWILNYERW